MRRGIWILSNIVFSYNVPSKWFPEKVRIWTSKTGNKYQVSYCTICEVDFILCPHCDNSSCSSGGCDKCHDDFNEWLRGNNE